MAKTALPVLGRGKRALLSGRTGSGKSTLANWLLARSPGYWIILNPKHTTAYNALPHSTTIKGLDLSAIEKAFHGGRDPSRFIVVNPSSVEANKQTMDDFMLWLHENYSNVGLCCDELYTLHTNGTAGAGLIGWLTRGRELKQSFLGLTQRPAWLSQFLFSESDYIAAMSLVLEKDRKRMVEMTGQGKFLEQMPPHYWRWYDVSKDKMRYFQPVPLTS